MSLLVIDVGTSSVRAAVMEPDASVRCEQLREFLPDSPEPGMVEFDARVLADTVLEAATAALAAHAGPVDAIGITNQRASAIVWDRASGKPIGPGIGWQDLRTIGMCLEQQANGFRFAPNVSATKVAYLLDTYDPDRTRDLCFGTVDSWVAWTLTEGAVHATDATNAGTSGLLRGDGSDWSTSALEALRIPASLMPVVVDSNAIVGTAFALPHAPPIAALVGDQQASLLGQACVRPGPAKITFGTGGMLDMVTGSERPRFETRGEGGTFPIIAWRLGGVDTWGLEAIMLAAGTNVEWLRDDLGILSSSDESDQVAQQCADSGGVVFVPAMLGLGTPQWDFGARGTVLGLTRGSGRPELVRAVLEGVAHRGADLVEAAETDSERSIEVLRIDGGMSRNQTFVQALADAAQKPVEVSRAKEATTLGAGFLAGLAIGTWPDLDALGGTWNPLDRYEPQGTLDRTRWHEAIHRARAWIPELSTVDF
ncbi:MAG: FGGY family carbohydrate kinase [Acidimicrobiia bacterium]